MPFSFFLCFCGSMSWIVNNAALIFQLPKKSKNFFDLTFLQAIFYRQRRKTLSEMGRFKLSKKTPETLSKRLRLFFSDDQTPFLVRLAPFQKFYINLQFFMRTEFFFAYLSLSATLTETLPNKKRLKCKYKQPNIYGIHIYES